MVDTGTSFFMCDECPISDGVDHRLRLAQECGYTPQLEYCGCDKVQAEFFQSGYCEDAYIAKPRKRKEGKRRTGSAYRSLSGIIRTRLSGRLIRSDCFLFIDGRQPICFI